MKNKILILLIFFTTVIYTQDKKLTINDIFTNIEFFAKSLKNVQWFDDGNKFSHIDADTSGSNSLFEYDVLTGEKNILFSAEELSNAIEEDNFTIKNYKWSPKENYMLFTSTITARTLKTGGNFYVYDVKKKMVAVKIISDKQQVNIKFSPDETKIGFVRANNLFVVDVKSGKETQLTFDGSEVILNGVFDWAYEEEFSIIEAWDWSPDSKKISFWRTDQSKVPVFPIVNYDSLYNHVEQQRYPKVGENISEVKIGVVDIQSTKIVWMNTGSETNQYIPRMEFTNDPDIISFQRLNRMQNKLELLFADVNTGEFKTIITEEDEHWVDVWDHLAFLKNSKQFIWSSEKDGYLHLYLYDYNGTMINQITKGNYEIDKLISVDEDNNLIYYTSNERSPAHMDLYSISIDGSNKKRITEKAGTHSIELSSNNKFFIDKYSNIETITYTSLHSIDGNLITIFYEPDMSFINDYGFSPVEFNNFTTSDGFELNSYIIKPHDFELSKKYPVVIFNYSGPGSKEVEDKWMSYQYFIFQYFAQNGSVVFVVDNRGTNGRGKEFEHAVYKNLGKWELNDIIEGISFLNKSGFVDTTRIAIYGSSYGGFMAGLALLKAPEYFKVAVDIAGLSHWKYYDAIYTERFMQNEALNPDGYFESNLGNYAENLSGKLLIIHGTADDNVHMQNSIELINDLQKKNKQFDLMIYPDKRHGGYGRHYYHLLTDYILKNL